MFPLDKKVKWRYQIAHATLNMFSYVEEHDDGKLQPSSGRPRWMRNDSISGIQYELMICSYSRHYRLSTAYCHQIMFNDENSHESYEKK
jgi:hypothetical protein